MLLCEQNDMRYSQETSKEILIKVETNMIYVTLSNASSWENILFS